MSIERQVRANLTKLVKFVVHPSAEPNTDLINLAFASGGSPKTHEERMTYLNILKQIARATPELVKEFTKTVTKADGTKVETLDGTGIDARVTMRALQYLQNPDIPSAGAESSTPAATLPTTTTPTPTTPPLAYPANPVAGSGSSNTSADPQQSFGGAMDTFSNTIHSELDGIRKVVQNQVKQNRISTGSNGTVSLLDLLNMNRALASFDQSQANTNFPFGLF